MMTLAELMTAGDGEEALARAQAAIEAVMRDPATSYWLKEALASALRRDPIDADDDAWRLAELIHARSIATMQVAVQTLGRRRPGW